MAGKLQRRRGSETRGAQIGVPHPASDTPPKAQRIRFSFHDMVGGYCLDNCTKDQKAAVVDALWRSRGFTWAELLSLDHEKLGGEPIARSALRAGVPGHITQDVKIWAFRAGLAHRMVGYYDSGAFHLVWLDLKMNLYDHGH